MIDQPVPARSELSYVIHRGCGSFVGPFFTETEAQQYVKDGDEILRCNEHGNIIDYGPQFGEGDD